MKKTFKNILSIIIIVTIIVSFFIFAKELKNAFISNQDTKVIEQVVEKHEEVKEGFTKATFTSLKEINSDMLAYIEFDSGIVKLPVVQGEDNEHYLTTSFTNTSNDQGAIFLDHSVSLKDQNPIIYGHNVLYDAKAKFSPLTKLVDQDYYEANSTFKLYLENEVRNYEIANVYIFDTRDLGMFNYVKPNFIDQEDFNNWYSTVEGLNLIKSTHGKISFEDDMMTLQTCKSLNSTQRIIIMAKLANTTNY